MTGSFLKNFSFTVVLNLLVKLFWVFVIEIAVQNRLGTEVYGTYFESFNFSFLFYILLDLGLSNYTSRTVAGKPEEFPTLFSSIFGLKLLLTMAYLLVLFVATRLMGYDAEHSKVVMIIGLTQVIMSMMLFFRSNVAALHLFKTDAVLSVADRLVMGAICAILLWSAGFSERFDLDAFLYAQLIGYAASLILALMVVLRQGGRIRPVFDRGLYASILKQSYPFAILFLLMSMYTRIDSVMLGRMLPNGEFQVGIYASAFRLLDAAVIFTVLLSNLLLPMFSRLIAQNRDVMPLTRESFHVVWIVAVLLPLGTWFYADLIYPWLYAEHHEYGSQVFGLLFFNFIPMALGYIFGTLLTAKGELRLLNLISVGGLLLNVVLNSFFIPRWEALGAVYATIATQSLVTASTFYFSLHYFRLRFVEFVGFRVLGYAASSLGVFYSLYRWMDGSFEALLLSVVLCLVLVPVFRLIRLKDLRELLRSGN